MFRCSPTLWTNLRKFRTAFDHSMILYGSSMSNGNQHDHDPLPIVLLGGASGQLLGNRHIVTPAHTPMSNLLLSMLDKLGHHRDSFGDSTEKLEIGPRESGHR